MSEGRKASPGWIQRSALLWVLLAVGVMFFVPGPPEAPLQPPEEEAIRQRMVSWALRDAEQWREEHGDRLIPWEEAKGRMAIVIDDIGREFKVHQRLQSLRYHLTFSILPGSVYTAGARQRLQADRRRYREIWLHLPMEPLDAAQMEKGQEVHESFLLSGGGEVRWREQLRQALQRVPEAVGINNHMGSRLSADTRAMRAIMPLIRDRRLYFLDSRTTAETVAAREAKRAGVQEISRDFFLDHDLDPQAVRRVLEEAVSASRERSVVVIAHPHEVVADLLEEALPELHASGIGIFPLSEIIRRRASDAETKKVQSEQ